MPQLRALFLSLVGGKGGHTGPPLCFGSFLGASSSLVGITTLEPPREALELAPGEHAERLVKYLISVVESSRYPSHQIMDRIERILFGITGR